MKSKLLLLICLLGALCFSCDDDKDNGPVLRLEGLSVSKGKIGDKIIIKGQGFSEVKDENVVKINGSQLVLLEASISELKVRIPEEITTGNLTVTVNEKTVDYGVFNIMQKTLFALKSDYDTNKECIVIIDPVTGSETEFMKLPQIEGDYWYSDLCFLEKSNEFIVLQKPEYETKDFKLLRINADSKEFQEVSMNKKEDVLDVSIMSDGLSHVYLENFHKYDVAYKSSFYKLDLDKGTDEFITEINKEYVKKCKIMNENSLMILMEDRSVREDSPNRIVRVDLSNGNQTEIIADLTYINGFSFGIDNNIFFATKDSYESESTLFELDLTSGAKKSIVNMPKIYGWYAGAVYIEKLDELVYFLSGQDDTDDVTDYLYKINVTDKSIIKIDSKNTNQFLYSNVQVILF